MRFKERVIDYEVIQDISLLEKSQLIIYGVSSSAERFWPIVKNYNIVGCSDGNTNRIGFDFHGYKVEGFKELSNRLDFKEVIILILSVYAEDIMEFCLNISDEMKGFVTLFGLQYTCLVNQKKLKLETEQRKEYKKYWQQKLYIEKQRINGYYRHSYYRGISFFQTSNDVLIYTLGKVATTAIALGLREGGCGALRVEGFSPYLYYILDDDEIKICQDLIHSIIKEKEKVKIITCVRDPIARDISALMYVLPEKLWGGDFVSNAISEVSEDLGKYVKKGLLNNINSPLSNCGYDSVITANMSENMKEEILKKRGERYSISSFFELELKDVFGIDVFAYPFDKDRGYSIISSNNIECLVLKQEKLWELESVIREFTKCTEFVLKERFSASQRLSGYVYQKVVDNIILSDEMLDWYYSNNSISHFYSEEEILEFRAKWSKCKK